MGSTSVRQPDPPDPVSAWDPMAAAALLNRQNMQSPFGRQTYYRRDANGDLVEWDPSDPAVAQRIQQALADPTNPDIGALLSVLPSTVRMEEDPRLRIMREQQQQADFDRRSVGQAYLSQLMGGPSRVLPESQFGLPVEPASGEGAGDLPPIPQRSPWGAYPFGGFSGFPSAPGATPGTSQDRGSAAKPGKPDESIPDDLYRARPDLTGAPDPSTMNIPALPQFQQPTLAGAFNPAALQAFMFGQRLPPVPPRGEG